MFGSNGTGAICCQYEAKQKRGLLAPVSKPAPRSAGAQSASGSGLAQQITDTIKRLVGSGTGDPTTVGAGRVGPPNLGSAADAASDTLEMVRWSKPIRDTRTKVSGINEWPNNALGEPEDNPIMLARRRRQRGRAMAAAPALEHATAFNGLGMNWEQIVGTIGQVIPATISAAKGQPYYQPASNVYQFPGGQPLPGEYPSGAGTELGQRTGGAIGNIGDQIGAFVAGHPYITLLGVGGAILLFMQPPSRRR